MNDQEVKALKDKLKQIAKNELVRMIVKAIAMTNYYKHIADSLQKQIEELKAEKEIK